jgi:hypothetical protein
MGFILPLGLLSPRYILSLLFCACILTPSPLEVQLMMT